MERSDHITNGKIKYTEMLRDDAPLAVTLMSVESVLPVSPRTVVCATPDAFVPALAGDTVARRVAAEVNETVSPVIGLFAASRSVASASARPYT